MQYEDRGGSAARTLAIGAVVGALLAGAAVGVLAAPESGAYTRRRIRRGLEDLGGRSLSDRWDDLSTGLSRRRERRERTALIRQLEERVETLESQLAEAEAKEAELEEEVEEEQSGSTFGSTLGLAAAALLSWFLSSEAAAPARERAAERAREVAERAREKAGEEWDKFRQRRKGSRRNGDSIVPETVPGEQVYQ
jgi:gas vesicle protein